MELMPVYPNRPPVVAQDGCTVFVSVHDAEHLRQRRAWKRKIKDAHPDRGGTANAVMTLMRSYHGWLASEWRWYQAIGVDPIRPIKAIGWAAQRDEVALPESYPCAICAGPVEISRYVSRRTNERKTCGRPWCKVEVSHRQQRNRTVPTNATEPGRLIPAYVSCPSCGGRDLARNPAQTRLCCQACGHLW